MVLILSRNGEEILISRRKLGLDFEILFLNFEFFFLSIQKFLGDSYLHIVVLWHISNGSGWAYFG